MRPPRRRQFDAVLTAACRQLCVPASGVELLHLHSNAIFAAPEHAATARVIRPGTVTGRLILRMAAIEFFYGASSLERKTASARRNLMPPIAAIDRFH